MSARARAESEREERNIFGGPVRDEMLSENVESGAPSRLLRINTDDEKNESSHVENYHCGKKK